jgi:hypothetical protein
VRNVAKSGAGCAGTMRLRADETTVRPQRALPSKARQRGEIPSSLGVGGTIDSMAEQQTSQPLEQQLQEIGAQLAWVRDYL